MHTPLSATAPAVALNVTRVSGWEENQRWHAKAQATGVRVCPPASVSAQYYLKPLARCACDQTANLLPFSTSQPYSVRPFVPYLYPCPWTAPILWGTSVLALSVFSLVKRDFPWAAQRCWFAPPLVFGVTACLYASVNRFFLLTCRYALTERSSYIWTPSQFNKAANWSCLCSRRYASGDCPADVHRCRSSRCCRATCPDRAVFADCNTS